MSLPGPLSVTDAYLEAVHNELRALRAELAADREARTSNNLTEPRKRTRAGQPIREA